MQRLYSNDWLVVDITDSRQILHGKKLRTLMLTVAPCECTRPRQFTTTACFSLRAAIIQQIYAMSFHARNTITLPMTMLSSCSCRGRSSPCPSSTPAWICKTFTLPCKLGGKSHVVVVAVAGEGIASFLRGRFLALGLSGRAKGVGVALELVTHVLGGGLLRVGLQGGWSATVAAEGRRIYIP